MPITSSSHLTVPIGRQTNPQQTIGLLAKQAKDAPAARTHLPRGRNGKSESSARPEAFDSVWSLRISEQMPPEVAATNRVTG